MKEAVDILVIDEIKTSKPRKKGMKDIFIVKSKATPKNKKIKIKKVK